MNIQQGIQSAALIGLLCTTPIISQTTAYDGRIGAKQIRLASHGSSPSPRFVTLRLGSDDRLLIDFDLLGSKEPILVYRLIHCNANWQPSVLLPIEYINGFEKYEFGAPTASRNTLMPYVHYTLSLPNEQTQIKRSGNYLLEVSRLNEEDTPILSIPFGVSEETVSLTTHVHHSSPNEVRGRYQQVDVELQRARGSIARPEDELRIAVLQNGRWDNAVWLSHPSSVSTAWIRYDFTQGASFLAGNEYHKFEHLTERGSGMGVYRSHLKNDLYEVELFPISNRAEDSYRHEEDHNGIQIIRALHTDNPSMEVDYHLVRFTLRSPQLSEGSVVLDGQAFDHLPLEARIMEYDNTRQGYTLITPIKMGYQEYLCLFLPEGESTMNTTQTEGNHYQTSNSYTTLVYQRTPSDRADRLVGTSHR